MCNFIIVATLYTAGGQALLSKAPSAHKRVPCLGEEVQAIFLSPARKMRSERVDSQ